MAGVSMARRVYMTIERELDPTPSEALQQWIDGRIEELFHCTPEQFRKYLGSIPGKQKKKP